MDKTQRFMNSVVPLFCGKHSIINITTSTFWNVTSAVKITQYFIKNNIISTVKHNRSEDLGMLC